MTDKPENPNAFPGPPNHGMTLRDYFAGQVIAGLAAPVAVQGYLRKVGVKSEDVAASAYRLADAMLKERSK